MENRYWHQYYPKGMPTDIDLTKYSSLTELLVLSCIKFRNQNAFVNMGQFLTYDDVLRLSEQFAAYLQNHTDLKPGDRIAIQMPNLLQYPVVLLGALRAGLIVVNTNPLYTPREMEHQFKDSGAKAIVILENFASHLDKIVANTDIKHVITTGVGDFIDGLKGKFINFAVRKIKKMVPEYHLPTAKTLPEVMEWGSDSTFTPVPQKLDDVAFLQYTGGTTGVSKGAMLTHGNLVANLLQIEAWKASAILPGQERIFTALPLYHIFALTVNCLVFMHVGALNILVTNARDLDSVMKAIKQYEPTFMTGVNTLFNALLNRPDFADLDFSKLKVAAAGGMAVQSDVVNRWKSTTGSLLMEGYGLTEASPVTHFNPMDGRDRIGSIGFPMPGTDVKIVNDAEEEVPFGEAGELCIKGPQVMAGYWNRPDETAKTIKNGWLHTGDIGVAFPDGFFKIVDRKKDMILVSGFNVYPNEIEEVISAHPKVKEVCAIGVPDEHSGEAVKVFIVRNGNVSVAELESYCKENFTGYKRPKYYEFRDELPKSNVGKLLRRPLREEELQKRK